MRILKFTPNPKPTIAILIKETDVEEMKKMTYLTQYLQKLASMGLDKPGENIVVLGLEYPKSGNIKKDTIVKCSNEILDYCSTQGIDTLYVADAKYYPYLSGNKKTEEFIGEVCKCSIEGYEDITVMPGLHHVILSFNPSKFETFTKGLSTLAKHKNGTLGIKSEVTIEEFYPRTVDDVSRHLDRLEKSDKLSIDIETRGKDKGDALRYDRGELSTIAISDTTSSGVAFPTDKYWVGNTDNEQKIRKRLKQFLITVLSDSNKKVYLHNGLFDAKFMIYNLFMDSDTDYEGMYEGIRLFSNMHDTMIMVYLCTNSTIKVDKGLKDVAREFIGNYAIDVKDITQHDLDTVLKYNLKDTCATMWVAEKYEEMLLDEDQHNVYLDIFRPSFGFLLEMMMTGLPVSLERTAEVKSEFQELMDTSLELIKSSHHVHRTIAVLKYNAMLKYNETHKKQKTEEDFSDIEFNPGSTLQMRILLFDILGLQIKDKTETGMPAVGGEILKEYKAEAEYNGDTDVVSLIGAILDYGKAAKMLGTFIKAIEELSSELSNGEAYLRGNLKLGGTQCVTDDVLFNTDRGVIPYNLLQLGDYVISHDGSQNKVTDLFYNGKKPIYKVTTEQGLVLTTSDNHPYFVAGKWVEAKDLKVDDNLSTTSVKEVWKVIKDFPRYSISSWGRVKNSETGNILKLHKKASGGSKTNRLKVTLSLPNGTREAGTKKDFNVHSLVAKAFIGPKEKGLEVRHLNGISWDNRVENLAYGTSKCNKLDSKLHGTMSKRKLLTTKLNQVQVDWLRSPESISLNNTEASNILNVSRELVRDIRNNKRWGIQNEFSGYTVDFLSDKVLSIEILPQKETYGVTIENTHSHVTNGIVTHNTGRLSASDPNLQNLPSGGKEGKLIKSCFVAPKGWLFCGSDFSALN